MKIPVLLLISVSLAQVLSAQAIRPADGVGQLGQEVSFVPVSESAGEFYMAQRTRDGRLILTPNESFFPQLGLINKGAIDVQDTDSLNGGNSFATIEQWDSGDVAEWGLLTEQAGMLTVCAHLSGSIANDTFSIALDDVDGDLNVSRHKPDDEPALTIETEFTVKQPGKHVLNLKCESSVETAKLHWIEVSGSAATDGGVLRKRWRPAAAHTKFSASGASDSIRMWVIEMDAVPGEQSCYAPMTTPFGYYGPSWRADGTVDSSFNFSLWSFGRNQPEPPVEQLSHLLAIGDRQAEFGQFGHEGSGVKIRNWKPLAGQQEQRQVLALRVQPGEHYDTYFSYFYEADRQRWRLFGSGNKFNKSKPLKSLWVGSFVEVPGRPQVQRTGAYTRAMRYRGWVMDSSDRWYPLDQMTNGNVNRATGLTHTKRGVTDDGRFILQTGGWTFRKATTDPSTEVPFQLLTAKPSYLSEQDIAFLKTVPSEITASIANRTTNTIEGTFQIRNLGSNPEVTVYWGPNEGLTMEDRWAHQKTFEALTEGENLFSIDGIPHDETCHVRFLLRNDEGQFWTSKTLTATPFRSSE